MIFDPRPVGEKRKKLHNKELNRPPENIYEESLTNYRNILGISPSDSYWILVEE